MRILKLCQDYPANLITQAVDQALAYGCAYADGVKLCLRQLMNPETPVSPIDLVRWPELVGVGTQTPDLQCYDRLLERV